MVKSSTRCFQLVMSNTIFGGRCLENLGAAVAASARAASGGLVCGLRAPKREGQTMQRGSRPLAGRPSDAAD